MALTRSLKAPDLTTVAQTLSESYERESLTALSQRKLNALAMPVAYIDRHQRYRFANKAFLDWIGKRPDEVLAREVIEVLGREIYQLYHAYIEAALAGGSMSTTTRTSRRKERCAASSSPTAMSIT